MLQALRYVCGPWRGPGGGDYFSCALLMGFIWVLKSEDVINKVGRGRSAFSTEGAAGKKMKRQ